MEGDFARTGVFACAFNRSLIRHRIYPQEELKKEELKSLSKKLCCKSEKYRGLQIPRPAQNKGYTGNPRVLAVLHEHSPGSHSLKKLAGTAPFLFALRSVDSWDFCVRGIFLGRWVHARSFRGHP